MSVTSRSAVELFHLVFLRALTARLEDKALVSLKGGCNLRFFFGSVRMSEDIDFDAAVMSKASLKKKVDGLLAAPVVVAPLRARGLKIADVSAPKQTDTTQRWKCGIEIEELGHLVRTKIEFSRRGRIDGAVFEAVPASFAATHGLPPFLATHYPVLPAVIQKIHALNGRTQPQARDVFDLYHLFPLLTSRPALTASDRTQVAAAVARVTSISFDDYASQVVAYLESEHEDLFASRASWDLMQTTVVERLEGLAA